MYLFKETICLIQISVFRGMYRTSQMCIFLAGYISDWFWHNPHTKICLKIYFSKSKTFSISLFDVYVYNSTICGNLIKCICQNFSMCKENWNVLDLYEYDGKNVLQTKFWLVHGCMYREAISLTGGSYWLVKMCVLWSRFSPYRLLGWILVWEILKGLIVILFRHAYSK